jgi:DegV family protein with EDD domain
VKPLTIVTDSAASLPEDLATRFGVVVVPLSLIIGGIRYADGELDAEEVSRRIRTERVTTSAPSPGDFVKAIEASDRERGVLVLTVASQMSAVFQAARTAAGYFDPRTVRVLDTGTAAGAQGLVVEAAAEQAAVGADLGEVALVAERVASRVRLVASLDDLDHLARSGRVPSIAARAGKTLSLHPLFGFAGGQVRPLRPAVGGRAVLGRLVDAVAGGPKSSGALRVAIMHAQAAGLAHDLQSGIEVRYPEARTFVAPFSSVMVVHTGPGLIGVAWWREEDSSSA